MQEPMLSKEQALLAVVIVALLDAVILASEVLDVVLEVKVEEGNEAKLGVLPLHSDTVVMFDAIDVVNAVSVLEVIFGSELVVGSSISLLV